MEKQQALNPQFNSDSHINDVIVDAIQDIKGKNILKLDLRNLDDAPTDYFIICEGDSSTQVKAISESISRKVKDIFGFKPSHVEGVVGSRWILVDYFDTIVHIFYPETREYYDIEDLWSDAESTEYQNL